MRSFFKGFDVKVCLRNPFFVNNFPAKTEAKLAATDMVCLIATSSRASTLKLVLKAAI